VKRQSRQYHIWPLYVKAQTPIYYAQNANFVTNHAILLFSCNFPHPPPGGRSVDKNCKNSPDSAFYKDQAFSLKGKAYAIVS
jgi:hypothetical protein